MLQEFVSLCTGTPQRFNSTDEVKHTSLDVEGPLSVEKSNPEGFKLCCLILSPQSSQHRVHYFFPRFHFKGLLSAGRESPELEMIAAVTEDKALDLIN